MKITDFIRGEGKENCVVLYAEPGNGMTTLLREVYTKMSSTVPCNYFSARHILTDYLKPIKRKNWTNSLFACKIILIDDIDNWYTSRKTATDFIHWLSLKIKHSKGKIILGCSNPRKDWTRSKNFSAGFSHVRIPICNPGYTKTMVMMQSLCQYECSIPEKLLKHIASYNGTISQYLYCLITIRFHSKVNRINLFEMSESDWNQKFNIKDYFPQSQLRKAFVQEWKFNDLKLFNVSTTERTLHE